MAVVILEMRVSWRGHSSVEEVLDLLGHRYTAHTGHTGGVGFLVAS